MPDDAGALLTDLYQLTMLESYHRAGMRDTAVFEFYARRLPHGRNYFVAAGLDAALKWLTALRFTPDELQWLRGTERFSRGFIDELASFRFTGDVDALPEGTVFFPNEPILRVTAPLPEAQFVESRLINLLQFPTLVASKAARCRQAAQGRGLVDFGFRRTHGADAGLAAARATYLVGFAGTATVEAGRAYGIPLFGTMAHSLIQATGNEVAAFRNFAIACPDDVTLLIDTYDTAAGARAVVRLAPELRDAGITIRGVRIDSGDLAASARTVRSILDEGGLRDASIFVSGGLDERQIAALTASGAPIDAFGVGTALDVSADAPYMECAYKLVEYAGRPTRKKSTSKVSLPGRKQVFRTYDAEGRMARDIVTVEDDPQQGTPLLLPMMRGGRLTAERESLEDARRRAVADLDRLPTALRTLDEAPPYPVAVAPALVALAAVADARLAELQHE